MLQSVNDLKGDLSLRDGTLFGFRVINTFFCLLRSDTKTTSK